MTVEVLAEPWVAACMDATEWPDWQRLNPTRAQFSKARDLADRPCAACPLGYAAEMRALGRCNGTPGGVEEDEEMDDRPDTAEESRLIAEAIAAHTPPAAPRGLSLTRRMQLEVAAPPCTSCAHEPVCALRAAFEGMATVETAAPPLPDGLRLTLTASVSCEHFLRDRAKPAPVRVATSQERGQANGAGAARKTLSAEHIAHIKAGQARALAARQAATG